MRSAPQKYVGFVKDAKRLYPDEFRKETETVEEVCKKLNELKALKHVKFDENANKACR